MMKSKVWSLFKVAMKNGYNINKLVKNKSEKKSILGICTYFIIIIIALLYSTIYSFIATDVAIKFKLAEYIPLLFFIIAFVMTFLITIYKAKGSLFDSKDNDMLFSLPIDSGSILTSRVMMLLIMNYMFSVILFLPSVINYGLLVQGSFLYYLISIIIMIFLPLIPTVLASIIGYIIAYISSKFKGIKIVETLVSFITIFLFMYISMFIQGKFNITNISNIETIITKYIPIFGQVKNALFNSDILGLGIYILTNIVIFFLFIVILKKSYRKIINKLKESKVSKENKKENNFKNSSITKSLVVKEFKRYITTPIYVFNTFFGVALLVILTVITAFDGGNAFKQFAFQNKIPNMIFIVFELLILFIMIMSNVTSSIISLEGNKIWILKTLPITIKKILFTKLLFAILVIAPISLICILILSMILKLSIVQILLSVLLLIVLTIDTQQFGLLINLKFPKLEFQTEAQVVKQSMSSFISIMVPMFIVMILSMLIFGISTIIKPEIVILFLIAIVILKVVIQQIILNNWGIKKFNKL